MNKLFIDIGGTSRSGSTLLDVILANDPKAMSLGEIHALFRPFRKHHFKKIEELKGDPSWSNILKGGKKELYPNLVKYFPDIDFFIDSSKDPFWFRYQENRRKSNYNIKHVLIYKTPEELAGSFIKRGKKKEWIDKYTYYHKKYFGLIDEFITISYRDLVESDKALAKLCKTLGMPYFPDKKKYWERSHNTFFGSNSIKAKKAHDSKKQLNEQKRDDIEYDGVSDEIKKNVSDLIDNNDDINLIFRKLNFFNVIEKESISKNYNIKYNSIILFVMCLKQYIYLKYRYYNPEDYFILDN